MSINCVGHTAQQIQKTLSPFQEQYQRALDIAYKYVPNGEHLTDVETSAALFLHNNIINKIKNGFFEVIKLSNPKPLNRKMTIKRNMFISIMEKRGVSSDKLSEIKAAETFGELYKAIFCFNKKLDNDMSSKIQNLLNSKKRWGIPLEYEQCFYKNKCFNGDCLRDLYVLFSEKTTNPEVIQIREILKKQYGVEFVFLDNDLERAKQILKSVEILKKNNLPIPNEYIVTNFLLGGMHLLTSNGTKHSVLIGSLYTKNHYKTFLTKKKSQISPAVHDLMAQWYKDCGFTSWASTLEDAHTPTHEGLHITHLHLASFLFKKIGSEFKNTINRISGYIATTAQSANEIYTELKTKSLYQPLKPDEEKLLRLLED